MATPTRADLIRARDGLVVYPSVTPRREPVCDAHFVASAAAGGSDWRFTQTAIQPSLGDGAGESGEPIRASWLLSGLRTSTLDEQASRIMYMGVCATNPDVYRAPVPMHAHVFHRGYAHMEDDRAARIHLSRYNLPAASSPRATTAPKSNIWKAVDDTG